ncbi:hypothetical protein [Kutzneria sp. NPDC052558]|uniref:hypothetical protein n=1 Tax=Kutzneria sp. NPDC052558 TaxID=3364121 RepID=UPI0037CB6B8E
MALAAFWAAVTGYEQDVEDDVDPMDDALPVAGRKGTEFDRVVGASAGAGAQVMAILRNLALGLLRLAGITQIIHTLQRIAADRTRILPIMAAVTSTNRL